MTTDAELIEKADALAEQFAVDKHARREIGSAILDALKRVRDEAWACGEAGIDDETATERELASMTIERLQAEAAQLRQRVADLEARTSADPMLVEARRLFEEVLLFGFPPRGNTYDPSTRTKMEDWADRYDATHGGTPTGERAERDSCTLPSHLPERSGEDPRRVGVRLALDALRKPATEFAAVRPAELERGLAAARDTLRTMLEEGLP